MSSGREVKGVLTYEGSNFFRQRLILATLSCKPVKICNIRANSESPGIVEYEASFIRLLDKICNGSRMEVSETGTTFMYKPGILAGGKLEHSCPTSRSIGYYLEPLMMLAPFCKKPLDVTLKGITNNELDPSVDMIKSSLYPLLRRFLIVDEGLELKCSKRGLPPDGGGSVHFSCPTRRSLRAFQWKDCGLVKRIRGVAFTSRVTPTVANRMLESAKGEFLDFITDVYLAVDNAKGACPGYGVCVWAETTAGCVYSAEALCQQAGEGSRSAEDVGKKAASALLSEIYRGGCADGISQPLVLLYMALAPRDVSKAVFGPLTPYSMYFLRHLRDFFKVIFKIEEYREKSTIEDEEDDSTPKGTGADKLMLSCVGVGYSNINKGSV